jgi:hypothetical protein
MLAGRAVVIGGGAIAALAAIRSAGGTWEEARTVMFTALVIGHLLHAYVVRLPLRTHRANPRLFVAVSLGFALQVAVVLGPWRDVFGVVALEPNAWVVAAVAGVIPVGILAATVALGFGSQPTGQRRPAPGPERLMFF